MHDWTLVLITVDWLSGTATLQCRDHESKISTIIAEGMDDLHIPRVNSWGPSVSINEVTGPIMLENDRMKMQIEIQSGDVITIIARKFNLPALKPSVSALTQTGAP